MQQQPWQRLFAAGRWRQAELVLVLAKMRRKCSISQKNWFIVRGATEAEDKGRCLPATTYKGGQPKDATCYYY